MQRSDDSRFTRIEDKIDILGDRLSSIDVTLAAQHESLKEHMRRTHLLETQIEPLNKHVAMMSGAFKLVGILSVSLGVIEIIIKMVGK